MSDDIELLRLQAQALRERELAWNASRTSAAGRLGQSVVDTFTGNDRVDSQDEGTRELPSMRLNAFETSEGLPPGYARATDVLKARKEGGDVKSLMGTAGDDTGKANILDRLTGGLPRREDSNGNILVTITPEKATELSKRTRNPVEPGEFYIDRPGFSAQDVMDNAPEALLAAALGPLAGLTGVTRKAAVGGAGALESVASDVAANQAGSQQPVSINRAAMSAVGAVIGDTLASRLANRLFENRDMVQGGKLTEQGRMSLSELGIDPRTITPELEKNIAAMIKRGEAPADAATVAIAKDLPVPVELTRGQAAGEPAQQMFESQAAEGAFGDGASAIMRGRQAEQTDQLEGNVSAIAQKIGGDQTGGGPALPTMQETLLKQREAVEAGVDKAYDKARATKAAIPSMDVRQAALEFRRGIKDFSPRFAPAAHGMIDDLDEIAAKAKDGVLPVGELEDWRRAATNAAGTSNNGTERAAAGRLVREYDTKVKKWIKESIVQGDEESLKLWQKAVKKRRNMGKLFEAGDIVEFVTKPGKDGQVPGPDEMIKRIYGTKGFTNQTLKAIKTLEKRLPKRQFDAIRQEAWLRLVSGTRGAMQADGTRALSGANLLKQIGKLKTEQPQVWNTMFNSKERGFIENFAKTLNRVTTPVRGGRNFSGTAAALASQVRTLFSVGLLQSRGLRALLEVPLINAALKMKATGSAVKSLDPVREMIPVNPLGVVGGSAATSDGDENNRLHNRLLDAWQGQ